MSHFNENVLSISSEATNETDRTMDIPLPWTLYAMCVIAAIGVPANLLTIIILLQPSMRTYSTFIYLAAIAVADTGVLVLWLLGDMNDCKVVHLADTHIFNIRISNMFCQLLSCWLLGAVITDRYICITHSTCASVIRNTTGALIAISVIVLLCSAITTFGNRIIKIQDINFSAMGKATAAFTTGVPFLTLFALISFIIYKQCSRSVTRESVLLRGGAESEQMKIEDEQRCDESRTSLPEPDKITYILLITTFSFLMLTLPFHAITFMSRYMYVEVSYVFRDVSYILWYSNYAVKMFLYILSGKRFREKMVNLRRSAFKTCNLLWNKEGSISSLSESLIKSPNE